MELAKLQRVVVDALEDVKAQNIKVYNTMGLSDMFDRVVLASGTSNRQTRALAYRVAQQVKEAGGHVVSVEGADAGEWVLVDLGDLVVHVMQPAIREYYGLEEIWGGKPVRVRLAESAAKRIAARTTGDGAAAGAEAETAVPKRASRPRKSPASGVRAAPSAPSAPAARKAGAARTSRPKKAAKSPARKAPRTAAKVAARAGTARAASGKAARGAKATRARPAPRRR